jgi:hypothetical protein
MGTTVQNAESGSQTYTVTQKKTVWTLKLDSSFGTKRTDLAKVFKGFHIISTKKYFYHQF